MLFGSASSAAPLAFGSTRSILGSQVGSPAPTFAASPNTISNQLSAHSASADSLESILQDRCAFLSAQRNTDEEEWKFDLDCAAEDECLRCPLENLENAPFGSL